MTNSARMTRRQFFTLAVVPLLPLDGLLPIATAGVAPSAASVNPWEYLLQVLLRKETTMESTPSLLLALLGPDLAGVDALEHPPEDGFEADAKAWMAESPAKTALMVQALYAALPYAFMDEKASALVGHLLARAVEGSTSPIPHDPDGVAALRREIREQLKAQFEKFRATIP